MNTNIDKEDIKDVQDTQDIQDTISNQNKSKQEETSSFNLEDFEELLKCDVCKDLLNEPKTLLCQHTFCASCISNLNLIKQVFTLQTVIRFFYSK